MHTSLLASGAGRAKTLRRWAGGLLALALPLWSAPVAQAQSVANYTFAASSGTFTALAGATQATASNTDDGVTPVLPVGFNFVYNGVSYNTFSASTNGFMGLGGQVSASFGNSLTSGGGARPVLAPLWDDLDLATTTSISYLTSGTAGSRVLTVEWLDASWNYNAAGPVMSFQAKLYEADGHVDFVYRQEAAAVNSGSASIGITAVATGVGNYLSLSNATAAPTASSTTETTSINTKPATGQTYTFTPAGTTLVAPSTLVFSGLTTTSGTVTFTDNSTNEFNFAVTVTPTAGGPGTTTIVPSTTGAGTGTTYTTSFTGLSANTGYTVQVMALGQGRGSSAATGTFTTLAGTTLNGVYYVGTGTSPQPTRTYATLTAAADAYTTGTLTGAVTFLLLDAAYGPAETFPITFGANTSASATNTLTVRPNVGVANVTITAPATVVAPSTGGGVLRLNGADYVILDGSNTAGGTTRNLTLTTASTTGVAAVQLVSLGTGAGATYNVIRNLNINGPSSTAGVGIVVGGATLGSTGADNDNLTIQNNNITSSFSGIFVLGTAAVSAGGTDGLVITGNTLGAAASGTSSLGNVGVLVNGAVNPSLTLNTVQNISGAGSPAGFSLTGATGATIDQNMLQGVVSTGGNAFGVVLGAGSTGATVTRNRILGVGSTSTSGYGGKGIDVATASATSNVLIANNFVQVTAGSGYSFSSDANIGIRLGASAAVGGVSVYYNSVNLTGTDIFNTASQSAALYVGNGATALDIRNNIFRNSVVNSANTGAKAYAIYSASANTAFTQLNYNDYFVGGTQGVLGYLGSDQATLAALQTATGKDANSLNVDPVFASTTDLHTNSAALNNVGTPITGITVDIDGDTRSTTTPDIGADEFAPVTLDLAVAGLVGPATPGAAGNCFGTAEAVTVAIRNAGSSVLNFATTPATITVVVTGPTGVATQTLTYVLNTGTLAPGALLNVPLTGAGTTVNLSTVGSYAFAITAVVAGDGNAANNTLTPSPTVVVSAPVAGTLAASSPSICVSGAVTLTLAGNQNGAIQLQSATSAAGPFTNVAGATTSTFTTPVLTSNMFYRAQITCGATTVTSNVVAVTVNNPLLTGTPAPVTICAGQTATLTASAATGTMVRFFTTATGGTALPGSTTTGTTSTVVTPALTTSTTYYAEAFNGVTETAGRAAPTVTTGFLGIDTGLLFSTTTSQTIQSAVIYPVGTGTITFALRTSAGVEIAATPALSVTGSGASTPVTVPLNLTVPSAGSYQLVVKAYTGITDLLRENPLPTGVTFPITSPSGSFSITNGINVTPTAAYYYFYNIVLNNSCAAATRTAIQVTVNPAANATFSFGTNSSFCATQATAQAAVLGTGATAGTFTSTAGLTINATTGAITPSTSTAGTYTVTNTVAAAGTTCGGTATSTVTIVATPATPTVVVTGTPATGQTLTATSTTPGVTYQFYRNGVLVAGTTGNSYLINSGTRNGTYTVVAVTAGGCSSAASAPQSITVTASAAAAAAVAVRLFPNPTPNGLVSVELTGYTKAAALTVLNALGQVVRTLPAATNGTTPLDLRELASGVYLLQVQSAGQAVHSVRFVKQ